MSQHQDSESELPPQRHFLFCPTQKPNRPSIPPKPVSKRATPTMKNRPNAHELLKRRDTAPTPKTISSPGHSDLRKSESCISESDNEKTPMNSPAPVKKVSSMMINLARSPPTNRIARPDFEKLVKKASLEGKKEKAKEFISQIPPLNLGKPVKIENSPRIENLSKLDNLDIVDPPSIIENPALELKSPKKDKKSKCA